MMPRYWTDTEGNNVGEWVEVSGDVWRATVTERHAVVASSRTTVPDALWVVWGVPGQTPVGSVYSTYDGHRFTDTRLLLVPLVEDYDAVVAGPRRGPDPLPDIPAPDYGDGMPY